MKELLYPFDSAYLMKKRKKIKRELLSDGVQRIKKKIAVLGGTFIVPGADPDIFGPVPQKEDTGGGSQQCGAPEGDSGQQFSFFRQSAQDEYSQQPYRPA